MTMEITVPRGRPKSRTGVSPTATREFAWHLASGKTQAEAARLIGYDPRRLTDLQRSREFAAELRTALDDKLRLDLAPKAIRALDQMISDDKLSPKVRLDVAKAILDRSGHSAVEAARATDHEGDPMETWSIDRLQRFVADFEAKVKAEEAKRAEAALELSPSLAEVLE